MIFLSKIIRKLILLQLKFLNSIKIINFYTTANFYSKYFKSTSQINIDNQVGIVIHGNIERKGKFTLNNIKKINKQYANIKIVFSTNSPISEYEIATLKENSCEVLINKSLSKSGFLNFNNQKLNTINGLKYIKLKHKSVKYALKLRSDQFFYNPACINALISLLHKFPIKKQKINSRIICLSSNSLKNIPFHINDMFQFGYIDDLIFYWSSSRNQNFSLSWSEFRKKQKKYLFSKNTPEIYLNYNFFRRVNNNCTYDMKNYIQLLSEYLILIDGLSIGFYWNKYFPINYQDNNILTINFRSFSFMEWLILSNDKNKIS